MLPHVRYTIFGLCLFVVMLAATLVAAGVDKSVKLGVAARALSLRSNCALSVTRYKILESALQEARHIMSFPLVYNKDHEGESRLISMLRQALSVARKAVLCKPEGNSIWN